MPTFDLTVCENECDMVLPSNVPPCHPRDIFPHLNWNE